MKPVTLLLALSLASTSVLAAAYKWVDQEGVVHYGDQPPAGVPASTVALPKAPPPPPPSAAGQTPSPSKLGSTVLAFTGYSRVAIVKPKSGATVRSNQEQVAVNVALEPPLQPEHKLVLLLDHKTLGEPTGNTRMVLQGIPRGTHSLQVKVVDANGRELGRSSSVSFTLRHAALKRESDSSGGGGGQSGAPYAPPPNPGQSYQPATNQGQSYNPPVPPVSKP
jgi:hypothetical protein